MGTKYLRLLSNFRGLWVRSGQFPTVKWQVHLGTSQIRCDTLVRHLASGGVRDGWMHRLLVQSVGLGCRLSGNREGFYPCAQNS